ncbi:hypothetical protein [Aquisphaera insulae]|uniref:HzsA-related protein n=1 Tax=Aquisphaera insulae TaxID=2712864 RepID=UPI0013EA87FB|nr:hypothetical protein [Aquisphaera insulae]
MGTHLVQLNPDGSKRPLAEGFQSARDADVSWDGRKILFAGKHTATDAWDIFEMDADGSNIRQVTRNLGSCHSPIYTSSYYTITEKEPWEQIAFVRYGVDQFDERSPNPATALWTCKLDGSYPQRITYNLSSDLDPAILPDGRIAYASWRRADFQDGTAGRLALETLNTDGTDRAPAVRRDDVARRMPCVTPAGDLIFVEPHDRSNGPGRLAGVSLRRPLHTYMVLTGPRDGLFHSPAPLPDGSLVVEWFPPKDGGGTPGLVRLDLAARTIEPILLPVEGKAIQPKAIAPRPRPDGRSSVVSPEDSEAELYCLDSSANDFRDPSWMPAGTVKTIRILEGMPEGPSRAISFKQLAEALPVLSPRRILAEIPVQPDGSFHAKVPANVPIQLQALDERGLALRSCGWIWARSHQAQGCIGCHEDPERTPPNRVPDALKTDVAMAVVPDLAHPTPDFAKDIAPIIESKCLPCHQGGKQRPELPSAGARDAVALDRLHAAILGPIDAGGAARGTARYVHPGRARTSPLTMHILGTRTARPWDDAEASRDVKPIPAGQAPALTGSETQTIIRWIDLGARRGALPEARRQAPSGSNP